MYQKASCFDKLPPKPITIILFYILSGFWCYLNPQKPSYLPKMQILSITFCSKSAQRTQNWYSKPWQASHLDLPEAVSPVVLWMFSYISSVYSAAISSLLRGLYSLSGWLTERGSGSCQRSMTDVLEMEKSQCGFYCHSWTCKGLQNGRRLICLRISSYTQRLHKLLGSVQ